MPTDRSSYRQCMAEKVSLARLPTPLEPAYRLSAAWGGPRIWIKRDDLTGFGLSGNKIRKLEYHVGAANDAGATAWITTGAVQSNHCRATALAAARLGVSCYLFLRTNDGMPPEAVRGNHLLHRLSGAKIRYLTPDEYEQRDGVMADLAAEITFDGSTPWVIPEGASDYLGMLGFAEAGRELAAQLDDVATPPAVWHPASSGGTTAGLSWAAAESDAAFVVIGCSVGDKVADLEHRLDVIWGEARSHDQPPEGMTPPRLTDSYVGGGYAAISNEELAVQLEATRLTGLLFDPVYTGKAIAGLHSAITRGELDEFDDVVFWHTGGGFGVFGYDWPQLD